MPMLLASDDENVNEWLEIVEEDLKSHGVALKLFHRKLSMGESSISGYFSGESKELVLNVRKPFLDLLVHEYCHFRQMIEIPEKFNKWLDASTHIWDWLDGSYEFPSKKKKDLSFDSIIKLEKDCELRSIEMIKKYSLPVNLDEYEKVAWIYISYYNYARKYRTWFKDNVGLKKIRGFNKRDINMNDSFVEMSEKTEKIFKKYSK